MATADLGRALIEAFDRMVATQPPEERQALLEAVQWALTVRYVHYWVLGTCDDVICACRRFDWDNEWRWF